VIGKSVQHRNIVLETFGRGPRRVLILGGVHGDEYGIPVVKAFTRYVRAHPSVVPSGTQLGIVACVNPDGYAKHRRTNAHKVDLNRNFPSRNWRRGKGSSGGWGSGPASEPETKALVALLNEGGFVRVVSMHSQGGIIDWDGPGGRTLAKRLSRRSHVRLHRLGHRPGSMGTYVPQRHRIPIITWELSRRSLTSRVRAGMLAAVR
jgi:predicted deacylase